MIVLYTMQAVKIVLPVYFLARFDTSLVNNFYLQNKTTTTRGKRDNDD